KTSPTIWVKFPIVGWKSPEPNDCDLDFEDMPDDMKLDTLRKNWPSLEGASIVIWTTTPWTIPGNRAISLSAGIAYGLYEVDGIEQGLAFEPWVKAGDKLVVADKLAEDVLRSAKAASWKRIGNVDPSGLVCAHPFRGLRSSPLAGEGREGGNGGAATREAAARTPTTNSAPPGGRETLHVCDVPLLAGEHVTD